MAGKRSISSRVARFGVRGLGEKGEAMQGARQAGKKHFRANILPSRAKAKTEPIQQGQISMLEAVLLNRLECAGLPKPEQQFRFDPTRRWRADFAYVEARLLIEADGGTWSGGRHVRGKGFEADCEKTSTAAALGWRVIRLTGTMIEDGRAVRLIAQALAAHSTPVGTLSERSESNGSGQAEEV